MLQKKKAAFSRAPLSIGILRAIHGLLALYAAAIIAVAFFAANSDVLPWFTKEVFFAVLVAAPIFLASVFSFLAATVRGFFGTAIFLCFFVALSLTAMPIMTTMFFPAHVTVFTLALVYGMSAMVLVHYYFSLPMAKKR